MGVQPVVMLHVFSNAGAMLLAKMNDWNDIFIDGIIFESCPGLLHPTLNINHINSYIHALIPRINNYPKVMRYCLFLLNYIRAVIFYLIYKIRVFRNDFIDNFFDKLVCKRNSKLLMIPSLFLYGNGDKSVCVEHIDLFISMKRSVLKTHLETAEISDSLLKSQKFDGSPHVQHYLKYPQKYKDTVIAFTHQIFH